MKVTTDSFLSEKLSLPIGMASKDEIETVRGLTLCFLSSAKEYNRKSEVKLYKSVIQVIDNELGRRIEL